MMKMNMIGNGGMNGVGGRYNNNAVVSFGNDQELFAIDMGFTYLQAMHEAGIPLTNVKYGFITHLDSDHVMGLTAFAQGTYWTFTDKGHQPHRLQLFVMPELEKGIRSILAPVLEAQGLGIEDYIEIRLIENHSFTIENHTISVLDTSNLHCSELISFALQITDNSTGENIIYSSDIKNLEPSGLKEAINEHTLAIYQDVAFPINPVHAGFEEIVNYYPSTVHSLLQLMHLPVSIDAHRAEVKPWKAEFTEQGVWVSYN